MIKKANFGGIRSIILYDQDGNLVDTDESVKVDDILIDGKTIGDIGELVIKDRELLGADGVVVVIATIDKATKKVVAGPEILTRGFVYVKESGDLIRETEQICLEVIKNNVEADSKKVDYTKIKNDTNI